MELAGKQVLVCGMARSGMAAAMLAAKKGAKVTLSDLKQREQFSNQAALAALEEAGVTLFLGKNPDDIITQKDLVIVSPGIPTDLPFLHLAREAQIPILSEVEFAYRFTPCPIIAITGTNGKTTTTALTGELMKSQYPNTALVGNIGVPYSEEVERLTKDDYVVAEISSFQMETAD